MPVRKWSRQQRARFNRTTAARKRKYNPPVAVEKPPIPEAFKYEGADDGTGGTIMFIDGMQLRRIRLQTVRVWVAEEAL